MLQGGAGGSVFDNGTGLDVAVGSSASVVSITGFATDTIGYLDLLNGTGGFTTVSQVLAALKSDGHGGTLLTLGTGSVDFVSTTTAQLGAAHFKIG